jgi:queuine tRNA-ribosyltransferase
LKGKNNFKKKGKCFFVSSTFRISAEQGRARAGFLKTAHGRIETPFFMPVATKGAVKLVSNQELEGAGTQCIICNAYIFSARPGTEIASKAGGIHRFIGWNKGIFTDSGGFQTLSESFLIRANEKGVHFRNPFDQSPSFLSPEKAVEIQNALGSDVAMCLDDVPVHGSTLQRLKESAERTTRWAERCRESHKNKKQLLFGICQGGFDKKMREKSSREIAALDFDGNALGGLCIGENAKQRLEMIRAANAVFPREKPRYLMGVGSPSDIIEAIALGVDVFDSCFPARIARHRTAITRKGGINLESGKFREDFSPIEEKCGCFTCRNHSRAFLHHLVKTKEENGLRLLSIHNISIVQQIVKEARLAIKEGGFERLRKEFA